MSEQEKERIVITGLGAITPLGLDVAQFWESVLAGRSGISMIDLIDTTRHSTKFGGEVKDFQPEKYIDAKEVRRMDRVVQFAVAASDEAVRDAGLQIDDSNRNRVGTMVGCGIGGLATWEREYAKLLAKGPDRVSPFLIPMMIPNMAAGHVSIRHGACGPNTAPVSACASSAHAIGIAFDTIRRGEADIIIAGGTEAPITDSGMAGFGNMRALSRRNDDPTRASRPFDATRDGFVIAEGSGMIILESLSSAKGRGAKIYAEMLGHGMTSDAYHITGMPEDGNGLARAMQAAMSHAGIEPEQVGYINAHGTSTPTNDRTETAAVKHVFGAHARKLAMSSTKSQMGHLLGAGSAAEFIATVLGLQNQIMPPTINYEFPDPDCDLDYVVEGARAAQFDIALSNSAGFGGHNAALLARRWTE